jgi:signal transduction histidine kinase
MNHTFQRSANAVVGSIGRMHAAAVEGEQGRSWFGHGAQKPRKREIDVRLEERRRERTRIARELHDTLFQGLQGASMILHSAVDGLPADSPSKNALSRALGLIYRVIEEGRDALDGLRSCANAPTDLEKAFADVGDQFTSAGAQLRISVMGRPTALNPEVQEQVYLIGREALVNALRHSGATMIEADIEYLPNKQRVVVRDNGLGISPEMFKSGRNSHWGLVGMHERAENIGAQLRIWSRKGAGTEVEISLPNKFAVATTSV